MEPCRWSPLPPLRVPSLLVPALILRSARSLSRRPGHILLEGVPEGLETPEKARALATAGGGVFCVHSPARVAAGATSRPERPAAAGLRVAAPLLRSGSIHTHKGGPMGKGDRRTSRGKTYRGSYGKSRPHNVKSTPADKSVDKTARRTASRRKSA